MSPIKALTRSPFLRAKHREMSQLLADQNRIIHALKTCKRHFPPAAPEPEPAHTPDPDVPAVKETTENFRVFTAQDIFPKTRPKSATSTPTCPITFMETNPTPTPLFTQPPNNPAASPSPTNPPIPHHEVA